MCPANLGSSRCLPPKPFQTHLAYYADHLIKFSTFPTEENSQKALLECNSEKSLRDNQINL